MDFFLDNCETESVGKYSENKISDLDLGKKSLQISVKQLCVYFYLDHYHYHYYHYHIHYYYYYLFCLIISFSVTYV